MDLRDQLQATLRDVYTLEGELGGGGMSRVFLATEQALGRPVVVKVLPSETAGALSMERFRREIRIAASLQQANIVPLLAAGEIDGIPYYTMPFVEGESLRARLAAHGTLPVAETVSILRDVARALAFAHERGVVHRDIKPDNVLLSGSTAVVTDFGIAKAVDAARTASSATLTQAGLSVGTPAYAAPEQACGAPDVDHRADIYALGVLAYELLAGAPPFAGRSAQATLAAHVVEQPVALRERRADVPPRLATLIMQCLEKEPAQRPATALDVLTALETALTPDAVPATTATAAARPSIAAVPFANLSPDPADGYFADGLTDEIITDLSPISELRVLPLASTMRFKGSDKDPMTIARELGVRFVLDGTVRRAGATIRLTARLIDTVDGSTRWSDKLGGSVEDVFTLQEQISRTIVAALRLTLTPQEAARLAEPPVPRAQNAAAVEAYLKGRHFVRQSNADALLKALECFQRATELEPQFAPALAGLAHNWVMMTVAWQARPAHETMPKATSAARRALSIDARLPEAHMALGLVATFFDWDPRSADRSFREALRLNPNYAEAHGWYAVMLFCLETRFDEALQHARRAVELNPVDPWARFQLAWTLEYRREYESAIEETERMIELEPMWGAAQWALGLLLALCGRGAEASACIERAIALDGRDVQYVAWLGVSHAIDGRSAEAMACLAELQAHERDGKSVWAWKLLVHSALGESSRVMDCLEQAYAERAGSLTIHLTHPMADCVRGTPRFDALLSRMRLEHLQGYRPHRTWWGRSVTGGAARGRLQ